jgi:hypothetical protein
MPYPAWRRTSAHAFQARDAQGSPLLARLNPEHGPALLALGCDLVWASNWMAEANEEIAPRIGLPQLPVVDWPEDQLADRGVHWKIPPLVARAAGRPLSGSMTRSAMLTAPGSPCTTQAGRFCTASTLVQASPMATSPLSAGG